ncbi:MAG: DUF2244 domain-containing protein [Xanthomonadales bacterium]|nr:hypothetical protein [Xanthomonadales bacterium]MCC6593289.1 DUF2244 domain-containing protein [Xanthomonadales bacterium]
MNLPISERLLGGAVEIVVRPNRSADLATLLAVYAGLSASVLLVSGFSFIQGNVLAPWFALLDLTLVAACFAVVWRKSAHHDCIRFDTDRVVIASRRGTAVCEAVYQTGWVRVWSESGKYRGDRCVCVGSHGRRTEVGNFLGATERERLERMIKDRLRQTRVVPSAAGFENEARGSTA